jgi:hypothetical protein
MDSLMKVAMTLTAASILASTAALARPPKGLTGPSSRCAQGRHPGLRAPRCIIKARIKARRSGRVLVGTGPVAGCPIGFHPGPWGARCFRNIGEEWIATGPRGHCPAGWAPGLDPGRCYPR